MKVLEISIKNQNGQSVELEKALFIKDKGIDGDKNAKGGERQISLLPSKLREMIRKGDIDGLCIKRYRENITYSRGTLIKGKTYKIGDAEIKISETNKACFPECVNIIDNIKCPLAEGAIFATIIKTGCISLNDVIEPLELE